jgi:DNA polymerase III subunit delta'
VATGSGDHSVLFHITENYRAGAEGKDKTDQLIGALYALLEDLMAIASGASDLVRNTDITAELKSLAQAVDFSWLSQAAQQLGAVQSGMRRNLLRSLSLDGFALSLER